MKFNGLYIILISMFLLSFKGEGVPHSKFRFNSYKTLKNIPEPSDIVFDSTTGHYFIVSDHGKLFECDNAGKIIRKAKDEGLDFEGVEVYNGFLYVSDETPRKVYKYKKEDLSLEKVYTVSFAGALNKAFESVAYNYTKNCFVLVSQQPAVVCEYDEDFKLLNKYPFHNTRDASAARWYKGSMYIMGNKDETIYKCDPVTYEVKETYNINVLNPEGLAFDNNGNVTITSDNLQRIYFFKNLPTDK